MGDSVPVREAQGVCVVRVVDGANNVRLVGKGLPQLDARRRFVGRSLA
jgi:hypothetical protein